MPQEESDLVADLSARSERLKAAATRLLRDAQRLDAQILANAGAQCQHSVAVVENDAEPVGAEKLDQVRGS